jgi:hypothetical protein
VLPQFETMFLKQENKIGKNTKIFEKLRNGRVI